MEMNSPLNQITKRLDEIDEARDKATKGKWLVDLKDAPNCSCGIESEDFMAEWIIAPSDDYINPKFNDAEFIALAANEIKSLTAALRTACDVINHYLEVQKFLAEPNEDNCASSNDFKEALKQIAEKLKG